LKELAALQAVGLYELHAIGLAELGTQGGTDILHAARVCSMHLYFRSMRWLLGPVRHFLSYLEMLLRVLKAGLSIRPHLIHCHDTPLLPVATLLAALCHAKVIYDAHELESDKNGQTWLISHGTLAVEKACWNRLDGFVTVSASILRWYEERFSPKDSVLVLNSPVFSSDPLEVAPEFGDRYFHRKFRISDDRPVFVYLGLLGPGRGVEMLLKAFSKPSVEAHVIFVGRGSLRETIAKHSIRNDRVHLHDMVPHEKVVPLVKNADYGFCMVERASLSDYYSLPNKLFEYAFAGLPVLASNFPDMQELVERFNLGFCTANNADAIVEAVVRLQGQDRQRMNSDIESLGWQAQAEKLKGLYVRLLFVEEPT
jgi:glycosyltransferase involved in cell wall biosynthesis